MIYIVYESINQNINITDVNVDDPLNKFYEIILNKAKILKLYLLKIWIY